MLTVDQCEVGQYRLCGKQGSGQTGWKFVMYVGVKEPFMAVLLSGPFVWCCMRPPGHVGPLDVNTLSQC